MTNEEAIEILYSTAWLGTETGTRVYPAVKLAIKALEKQIPKKPVFVPYDEKVGGGEYVCSACHKTSGVILRRWEFCCHHCGQAIDWSEVE